jgi:invasion protein IalB
MKLNKLIAGLVFTLSASTVMAEEPNARTVTEQFKNWRYACVEQGENSRCEIGQAAVNDQGQMVSQIIIGKNPEGKGQVQIIAPLMMDLKAGMQLQVDQQKLADLDYLFCNQGSCVVAELLSKDMLRAMKAGNDMQINIAAINGQTMTITYSLSGFSAAYARLMDN